MVEEEEKGKKRKKLVESWSTRGYGRGEASNRNDFTIGDRLDVPRAAIAVPRPTTFVQKW